MLVLKFGGTSVASAKNIALVKEVILEKQAEQPLIAVVSALGGITTQLVNCSTMAATGDAEYIKELALIEQKHIKTIQELIPLKKQAKTLSKVKILLNDLEDICRGVFLVHELTAKTSDKILSFGERLSSAIIADYFIDSGFDASLADPRDFIVTDSNYGRAEVDFETTNKKIKAYFDHVDNQLVVCPGFIAASRSGEVTTLGRGGSDYTAAILAAALDSAELEIWTDVSGMMTADPRLVSSAYAIPHISYEEAMELSHFGAKVIYPPTIQPVLEKNIAVRIKNTFKRSDAGTIIQQSSTMNGSLIKGLSCIQNIALFNLSGSGMVGIPNFSHRLFRALSNARVNVVMITQASSEHTICVGIDAADAGKSQAAIEGEFAYELASHKIDALQIETRLAIIALVGSNMKEKIGVSGTMFSVLGQNGINIKAIAQGSSEKNISVVIHEREVKKALNSLHESFFLSEKKRMNLFIIGVGNVGSALIAQLRKQKQYLSQHHHIDLKVVALANSRKMYFEEEGINLKNWQEHLNEGEDMNVSAFLDNMESLNLRNSIFIDNTANADIAALYSRVLHKSISVVTPNKIACTNTYDEYVNLKQTALQYKSKFLFETNVGAGLPVINTLNDLIKSGDEILKIEAVLSGSLNFIFNNYGPGVSFVDVVRQAQVEGYTEPDPRIDLSGVDVKRKILILIRESGLHMELDDIPAQPFIPEECMVAESIDAFFDQLAAHESTFQKLIGKASKAGDKIKYVATYNKGKAQTGLQFIDKSHPFYNLEGKDNIVLFTTKRYPEQPLVIKGAGAGAEVTASGIFADIMRIANAN